MIRRKTETAGELYTPCRCYLRHVVTEHMPSSSFSGRRHSPAPAVAVIDGRSSQAALRAAMAAAVAFIVASGIFVVTRPAHAGIGDIFALGIAWIFNVFTGWVGQLLLIVVSALIWVAQYNGFVTSPPVANGWSIVRDVTNMFFILVLLVIAFGTILGVDAYSYKNKMLSRLLIMAVVVNFSRTICGLIIDFAQVVMLTFVYGFKEAAGGNFADALRITTLMQSRVTEDVNVSAWSIAVAMILAFFMTLIALVVVILMTITLAIRIVYLWLLVVLSPLAFFLKAVPGGSASGYYGMWWKMFTGQVVVGPVMAFFLWLSLVSVASNNLSSGFPPQQKGAGAEVVSGDISQAFQDSEIEAFIIAICLLMGGLQLSKQISSESAGAAPGIAKKAASLGMRAAKGIGKGAVSTADRVSGGRLAASGIPVVSRVAGDARLARAQEKRQKESRAQAITETLSPGAQKSLANSFAITADGKAKKEAAQRAGLKNAAGNPPTDPKDVQDLHKWRKDLRKSAEEKNKERPGTGAAILKDLGDFENRRPSLIMDPNEKDAKERERQEKSFRKSAGGFNAARMSDMDAKELSEQFLAFANPKAVLKAQETASGDQLAALKKMGGSEKEIMENQDRLRARPENFKLLSEQERADLITGMKDPSAIAGLVSNDAIRSDHLQGAVADALMATGALSQPKVADKVSVDFDYDKLRGDTDLAMKMKEQIAAGISSSGLKNMPKDIADALMPLVAEKQGAAAALGAGASMGQAFKGYEKDGNFADASSLARFEAFMQASKGAGAGVVPAEAITKNGGMNEVALSMVNNLSFQDITKMVESGNNDQAAAILDVAKKLGSMSDSKEALEAFQTANPGIMMNSDQLKAVMTKGALMSADADKGALKDAEKWNKVFAQADRNEAKQAEAARKLSEAGERMEKKLMAKKRGRRG